MKNLLIREEKQVRMQKKLNHLKDMYSLVFEINENSSVKIKKYMQNFDFETNERSLKIIAKNIAKQVKEFKELFKQKPKEDIYFKTAERLTVVHDQIVEVIREEFKTLRNRNDRISRIED